MSPPAQALQKCGADFTLIQRMFPGRSRRQILNKFRREERKHPALVDKSLACKQLFRELHARVMLTAAAVV